MIDVFDVVPPRPFQYCVRAKISMRFSEALSDDGTRTRELRVWLRENIGRPYEDWQLGFYLMLGTDDQMTVEVHLHRSEDATLTSLRWS